MKHSARLLRLLVCLLAAGALLAALALSALKAYSLYNTLCRKIDYTNNTVYAIGETVERIYQAVNRESSGYSFDYSWIEQTPPLIAHAFGGIDGQTYTNSAEAFAHNYAQGHRIFEVDLDLTDENILVASHDRERWKSLAGAAPETAYTYENFMSAPILDRYTAMDYRDVVDLMIQYPDIYIVTDNKYSDLPTVLLQFSQLVKYASERDSSVLERIIPQVYHQEMLHWVMSVHPFRSVILTLYNNAIDPQTACAICQQTGVRFITAPEAWIDSESASLWDALNITTAAHTVNSAERAGILRDLGVDFIYTDFLTPGD